MPNPNFIMGTLYNVATVAVGKKVIHVGFVKGLPRLCVVVSSPEENITVPPFNGTLYLMNDFTNTKGQKFNGSIWFIDYQRNTTLCGDFYIDNSSIYITPEKGSDYVSWFMDGNDIV